MLLLPPTRSPDISWPPRVTGLERSGHTTTNTKIQRFKKQKHKNNTIILHLISCWHFYSSKLWLCSIEDRQFLGFIESLQDNTSELANFDWRTNQRRVYFEFLHFRLHYKSVEKLSDWKNTPKIKLLPARIQNWPHRRQWIEDNLERDSATGWRSGWCCWGPGFDSLTSEKVL